MVTKLLIKFTSIAANTYFAEQIRKLATRDTKNAGFRSSPDVKCECCDALRVTRSGWASSSGSVGQMHVWTSIRLVTWTVLQSLVAAPWTADTCECAIRRTAADCPLKSPDSVTSRHHACSSYGGPYLSRNNGSLDSLWPVQGTRRWHQQQQERIETLTGLHGFTADWAEDGGDSKKQQSKCETKLRQVIVVSPR